MLSPQIEATIAKLLPELVQIRRDLHQHPELGFEEHRTQAIVKQWLSRFGHEPRPCAETGVLADSVVEEGRALVGLRADLDCLPMPEVTDLPYRSVHDGRAHKCGHDGHTAILMGVAAVLAEHRRSFAPNVRFIFQPAEEGVRGGGAKVMVAEGALTEVREIYGLHNWPGFPKGTVAVENGATMAQVHNFSLRIIGVGGHGSQPQLCIDPIVAGAQLVTALQTIGSRELGYDGGAVVSVGRFAAGTAENVIPGFAELQGTIRTFAPEITKRVVRRFDEIVRGIELAMGVRIEVEMIVGYPVLVNDARCADVVRAVARRLIGEDALHPDGLPMAGGEDFAYFAEQVPAAYFFLGAQLPGETTPVCHHPDFDFDDDLITTGIRMFLGILQERGAA